VLAQVAQQGIDIWHAGPIGAFVEEEVVRWLCDLVGYGEGASES
jgi:glutamate/tyrosine decarboxylase-like PLP-dependent enzyme